jgi:hypothetical protein
MKTEKKLDAFHMLNNYIDRCANKLTNYEIKSLKKLALLTYQQGELLAETFVIEEQVAQLTTILEK